MHAVPIYWVCCKIATMLHICCSMQLQPDFCIQELSQTVFKHNWVILYLNLPFLGILTNNEIFNNFCCCSCKYAAICSNTAFQQWAFPRIVIITSNNTHIPNLRLFYACSWNLLSMLQNNHYAAHMQLHAAATWFFHTRAILNCFEPQIWYNITILIHFHAYSRDQKKTAWAKLWCNKLIF